MNNKIFLFFSFPIPFTGRFLWNRIRPFAQFSAVFLELAHWFFLKLYMVLGVHMWMCLTAPNFLGKILIGQKWSKMVAAHFEPISIQVSLFFVFFSILQTPVTWLLIVANSLVAIWSVGMPRMWSTLDIDSECVTLYVTLFFTLFEYFVIFCEFVGITDKLCWYTNKNKVIMKL